MNIHYKGITAEKLKTYFEEVYKVYEDLHPYKMVLQQKRVKASTMQAQPIISLRSLLGGKRKYKIQMGVFVKDSTEALIESLPEKVIKGWYAHELGHLIDYEEYSDHQMVIYGIKYLSSEAFKRKVEHDADLHAINHGFGEEIIAAKKFIFSSELFGEQYKQHIKTYYMSIEEVEQRLKKD